MLGPVCQWRSCSCAARVVATCCGQEAAQYRPLCAWHRSLKRHLDDGAQAAGRASDALRFVPRAKAAREAAEAVKASKKSNYGDQDAAEAAAIRGASPLLVELSNGKLGQTVRVFCRRAAAGERGAQIPEEGQRGQGRGGWARWDDARALSAARRDVAASLDRLIGSVLPRGRPPASSLPAGRGPVPRRRAGANQARARASRRRARRGRSGSSGRRAAGIGVRAAQGRFVESRHGGATTYGVRRGRGRHLGGDGG